MSTSLSEASVSAGAHSCFDPHRLLLLCDTLDVWTALGRRPEISLAPSVYSRPRAKHFGVLVTVDVGCRIFQHHKPHPSRSPLFSGCLRLPADTALLHRAVPVGGTAPQAEQALASADFVTLRCLAVQVMHSEWSPGQPYQPGDSFKPGLWQGCKPYNEVNSVNLDFSPGLWPSPADKLQSKENMQSNGSFRPDKVLDLYPQFSHWKSEDDHTLSPYLDDRQYQHAIPAASSAPSSELQTNHTTGVHQYCQ